jgi:hypothetical protein
MVVACFLRHGIDEKYPQNLSETPKGRHHLGDLGEDEKELKLFLKKWGMRAWNESKWNS